MNAMPNHQIFSFATFAAANDDRAIAPVQRVALSTERRLMAVAAVLAAVVLAMTLVNGYIALRPVPDATFAFRV